MKKAVLYTGNGPNCIDGFPKSCKRSVEGALHLHPRRQLTITNDEYEFLKTTHVGKFVKVIANLTEDSKKEQTPKLPSGVSEKAAAVKDDENKPKESEDSGKSKGSKKKRKAK